MFQLGGKINTAHQDHQSADEETGPHRPHRPPQLPELEGVEQHRIDTEALKAAVESWWHELAAAAFDLQLDIDKAQPPTKIKMR